jgi:hypothetical protein
MGIKSFCLVIVVVLLSVYYYLALIQSRGVKKEVRARPGIEEKTQSELPSSTDNEIRRACARRVIG